jgi:hypothetical protein
VTAPAGDTDRLFIVERRGTIRIFDLNTNSLLSTPFLDIASRVTEGGDLGLLSMAFHPDYANNGRFFVHYGDNSNDKVISEFKVSDDNPNFADPGDPVERVVLRFPPPMNFHAGGSIAFGPLDGYLYITSGDGGPQHDANNNAQNPLSYNGKLLRVDVDAAGGIVPETNPYADEPGVLGEIWALGLRNSWRLAFDALTGDLYIGDVGQSDWEEINFQPGTSDGGENYEWKVREGESIHDSSVSYTPGNRVGPLLAYHQSTTAFTGASVTGGVVYRGSRMPDLQGTYIFADWTSHFIRTFRVVNGAVVDLVNRTSEMNAGIPGTMSSIVAFGTDGCGEMYVLSTQHGVFRIVPTTFSGVNPPVASITMSPRTSVPVELRLSQSGATIILSGSPSHDGDGMVEPLSYEWEKISGPENGDTFSPIGVSTTIDFSLVGVYEYRLTVTDGQGSDTGDIQVIVRGQFRRGEANGDGVLDIVDALYLLFHLFAGTPSIVPCADVLDADDSGGVDIADAVRVLSRLFVQDMALPSPGSCGVDPDEVVPGDDGLGCDTSTCE